MQDKKDWSVEKWKLDTIFHAFEISKPEFGTMNECVGKIKGMAACIAGISCGIFGNVNDIDIVTQAILNTIKDQVFKIKEQQDGISENTKSV